MKPLDIEIDSIQVLDRFRSDLGDIDELARSLARLGLIQPIVLTSDANRLIAGGRRLAAAKKLGWKTIPAVYRETLSDDELHEMELEENVRRKDMTWQERCLLIRHIHNLKKRNAPTEWGQIQTAELLGLSSNCSVSYAIKVAKLLDAGDKEVNDCDSMMAAYRLIVRRTEDAAMRALVSRQVKQNQGVIQVEKADVEGLFSDLARPESEGEVKAPRGVPPRVVPISKMFFHGSCLDYMKELGDETFSYIISDPPYAIDMDMLEQSGSQLSDTSGVREEHDQEENINLLGAFIPEAIRVLKDRGWIVLWTDQMTYPFLHSLLEKGGLRVQRWPLVWAKTHVCKNEQAYKNFTKTIEVAIVAAKGTSTLLSPSPTCHWTGSNEEERKRYGHMFAKPHDLWRWIYQHVCIQGSVVFDPFAGRGSSMVAAIGEGLLPIGCEIRDEHYAHLVANVKARYVDLLKGEVTFV